MAQRTQSNWLPHHCGTTRSGSDHAAAGWKPAAVHARSKMQHPGTAGAYMVYPAAGIMDHGSPVIEVPSASPCELERFLTTTTQRHEEHINSRITLCVLSLLCGWQFLSVPANSQIQIQLAGSHWALIIAHREPSLSAHSLFTICPFHNARSKLWEPQNLLKNTPAPPASPGGAAKPHRLSETIKYWTEFVCGTRPAILPGV